MSRRDELPIYWRDDYCDCDERSAPRGVALGVLIGGMLWVVALVAVAKACGV